jgi:hypothetical protein
MWYWYVTYTKNIHTIPAAIAFVGRTPMRSIVGKSPESAAEMIMLLRALKTLESKY